MALFLAGVNPRRSDFVRAGFLARSREARNALLRASCEHRAVSEALLIADEERVEWYAEVEAGVDAYEVASQLLSSACDYPLAGAMYFAEGLDATSHLLAAVAGLDEFSLGGEGLGASALRGACAEARSLGSLGKGLDAVGVLAAGLADALQQADGSGNREAQAETAVRLAKRVFGHVERRSVLAVGESPLALAVGAALARSGVEDFTLLGDVPSEQTARDAGVRMASVEALEVLAGTADVVLAGSPVEGATLDLRLLKRVARARRGRPTLLLDCSEDGAVIDGRASRVDGVFLYTAADLEALARETLTGSGAVAPGSATSRETLLADAIERMARELAR